MARYKEQWESPNEPTVVAIQDTVDGWGIPIDEGNQQYQEYLAWVAEGNTPDPAYTAEELAGFEAAAADADARAYLIETGPIITTYNDDITRKGKSKLNKTKVARIAKHRERARRRLINPYQRYSR